MRVIYVVVMLFLVACAVNNHDDLQVAYGERQTLHFTGRGAAAGIMMDSLLGGTGVAIGIAIDEGISKDIAAAISVNNPKFSMGALVKDTLDGAVSQGVNIDGLKSVIIEKYGFQSAPDDTVIPLLELQLVCRSGLIQKINFVPNELDRALPFDKVKTDGSLAEKALRGAVEAIFSQHRPSVCISV
jgi:hypothetical protein